MYPPIAYGAPVYVKAQNPELSGYLRSIKRLAIMQSILGFFSLLGLVFIFYGYSSAGTQSFDGLKIYLYFNRFYAGFCMLPAFVGFIFIYVSFSQDANATCTLNGEVVPFADCRPIFVGAGTGMAIFFSLLASLHMASASRVKKALSMINPFGY
jgi:hypothetical protein